MNETPPEGLTKSLALWNKLTSELEFRPDELVILEEVCREIDLVDRMEVSMRGADLVVKGSQGQPVAAPMVQELRQHRATITRLLQALRIPEEDGAANVTGQRSAAARALANARWAS